MGKVKVRDEIKITLVKKKENAESNSSANQQNDNK